MFSDKFQLHKVRRLIHTNGLVYDFVRPTKNEFGEFSDENTADALHISVRGMYHETSSYLSQTASDSTTIRKQVSPMILCTWENAKMLKQNDRLKIHDKLYTISGVKDIAESQVIADISLTEVQQ